ncbi:MAG: hypothetical protein AAGC70_16280 [Pseudomonadota bacterium]
MTVDPPGHILVHAGWQALKARWVSSVLIAAGLLCLILSGNALTSGTSAGGKLAPLDERIMLMTILIAVGLLCSVGSWIFLELYVVELHRDGNTIHVTVLRPFMGQRVVTLPIDAISDGGVRGENARVYHRYGSQKIDAPWIAVKVKGWWFPLIVDLQSEKLDNTEVSRLFGDARMAKRKA